MQLLVLDLAQTHNCRGRFSIPGFDYKPLKFKGIKISRSDVESYSDIQKIAQRHDFHHVQGGKPCFFLEVSVNFYVRKTLSRIIFAYAKYQELWNSSSVSGGILLCLFAWNLSFPVFKSWQLNILYMKGFPWASAHQYAGAKAGTSTWFM